MSDQDYVSRKHQQEMEAYYALYPGDAGRELKGAWEHKFTLMRACNAKSDEIVNLRAENARLTARVKVLESEKEAMRGALDIATPILARVHLQKCWYRGRYACEDADGRYCHARWLSSFSAPQAKAEGQTECLCRINTPTSYWLCPRPQGHEGSCGLKTETDAPPPPSSAKAEENL